jgi:predicted nicotinamide N-methyase
VAARTLLRHLATEREAVVCEIGCGPGLPSLAALAAGARSVIAVDMSPLALSLVSHAARSYQPSRAPRLTTVQRNFLQQDGEALISCDYLVAADLLYDLPTAQAVGRYVGWHVRRGGATAIIADPGRMNGQGRAAFARGLLESDCISEVGTPRVRFTDEALPRRWRGVKKHATMGMLVLEPEGKSPR